VALVINSRVADLGHLQLEHIYVVLACAYTNNMHMCTSVYVCEYICVGVCVCVCVCVCGYIECPRQLVVNLPYGQ